MLNLSSLSGLNSSFNINNYINSGYSASENNILSIFNCTSNSNSNITQTQNLSGSELLLLLKNVIENINKNNFCTSIENKTDPTSTGTATNNTSVVSDDYQKAKENLIALGRTKDQALIELNGLDGTNMIKNIANYKSDSIVESEDAGSIHDKKYNTYMLESKKGTNNSGFYKDLATKEVQLYNYEKNSKLNHEAAKYLCEIEKLNKKIEKSEVAGNDSKTAKNKIDKEKVEKEIEELKQKVLETKVKMQEYTDKTENAGSKINSKKLNSKTLTKVAQQAVDDVQKQLDAKLAKTEKLLNKSTSVKTGNTTKK